MPSDVTQEVTLTSSISRLVMVVQHISDMNNN